MAALSRHPHLRRMSVRTARGVVQLPAPGAIFAGRLRSFGAVPRLGEHDLNELEAQLSDEIGQQSGVSAYDR